MDHEAYEKQMIESVNRNAEEASKPLDVGTSEKVNSVVGKRDTSILKRGLKRTLLALVTVGLFAISACGFFKTATTPGYLAVLLFLLSVFEMMAAVTLLYTQGITNTMHTESKGETK